MKVFYFLFVLCLLSCVTALHTRTSSSLTAATPDFGIDSLIRESKDIAAALEHGSDNDDVSSIPVVHMHAAAGAAAAVVTKPHTFHSSGTVHHHHHHTHHKQQKVQTVRPHNFQLRAYAEAEKEVEKRYPVIHHHHHHHHKRAKDSVNSGVYFSSTDRPRRNPHIEPAYRHRRGIVAHTAPVLNHPLIEDDTRGGRIPSKKELEAKRKQCCEGEKPKTSLKGTTPLTRKLVDTVALLKSILEEKKSALKASEKPAKLPGDDLLEAQRLAQRLDRLQEQLNEAPQPGSTMVSRLKRQQRLLKTYKFLKNQIKTLLQNYAMEHGTSAIQPEFRHLLPNIADSPEAIVDFYARQTNELVDDPEHPLMLSPTQVRSLLKKRLAFDLKRADESSPSKTLLTLKKDGTLTTQYDETGRAVMTLGDNDHPKADIRLHIVPSSAVGEDGMVKVGKGFAQQLIDDLTKYNKLRPSFPPKAKDPAHPSQSVPATTPAAAATTTAAPAAAAKAPATTTTAAATGAAAPTPAAASTAAAAPARFMQVQKPAAPAPEAATAATSEAAAVVTTQTAPHPTLIEHDSDIIIGAPSAQLKVPYIMPLNQQQPAAPAASAPAPATPAAH